MIKLFEVHGKLVSKDSTAVGYLPLTVSYYLKPAENIKFWLLWHKGLGMRLLRGSVSSTQVRDSRLCGISVHRVLPAVPSVPILQSHTHPGRSIQHSCCAAPHSTDTGKKTVTTNQ